jgi:cutinase
MIWHLLAVTLIYVGLIAGPPFISALQKAFGAQNFAAQGVNYPADAGGNFDQTGNNPGIPKMIANINKALANCPSTQIILGGYSQGGLVTHGTLNKISQSTASHIKAVVLFGDEGVRFLSSPLWTWHMANPKQFQQEITSVPASEVKSFCAKGDDICEKNNFTITAAHLSYGNNAAAAAAFCKSQISV